LEKFLLGKLPPKKTGEVIRHLVSGCDKCRGQMEPISKAMFRLSSIKSVDGGALAADVYDRALSSAHAWALARWEGFEKERAEVGLKMTRLLYGKIRGGAGLPAQPEFWTKALCEALLERSWGLRHEDPQGMLRLAELAAEAAQRLDAAFYGEENVSDLQARALSVLANALRISDQLPLAQEVLKRSFDARKRGTGDPLLRARVAELTASLMCDLRQFPTAFRLLDLSFKLYTKHCLHHEAGHALIKKGIHTGRSGDPEDAIRLLARGLRLIDRSREPKLPFHVLHNILLFRIELGQFRTARRQLWEMRPLYERYADKINLLRLRWLEGKIFVGIGDLERAVRALLQAKERFEQAGMTYDAALISFDLASAWLQEGKRKEVRQLIHEMLETFRARYIAREAIASLLMLRDAADRGSLSLDLLDMVAGYFRSLKDEPKAQDLGEMH
jgi:tetratricopeptide (TPR) repeat protein